MTDGNVKERRRKRFTNRSRQGCARCRQRRQKCDEFQPQCSRCASAAVECVYPPGTTARRVSQSESEEDETCAMMYPVEDKITSFPTTSLSLTRYGAPSSWNPAEVEGMYYAIQYNNAITYRDGHLLAPGLYMFPHFIQHSFQSPAARNAVLAMRCHEKAIHDKSLPLALRATEFKIAAMSHLQQELRRVDNSNVDAILTAAMCLFVATSATDNPDECARLNEGADAAYRAVVRMAGRPPYGLPDTTNFTIDRIYMTLDHDYGLTRTLSLAFQRFVRVAAPDIPECSRAIGTLTNYHVNMPRALHKSNINVAAVETSPSTLRIREHVPATMFHNLGKAKAPFLILVAFYAITILVSDVLRPDWVEEGEAQDLYMAGCVQRVYNRLVEDGKTQWLKHAWLPYILAEKFLSTGTMLPPFELGEHLSEFTIVEEIV